LAGTYDTEHSVHLEKACADEGAHGCGSRLSYTRDEGAGRQDCGTFQQRLPSQRHACRVILYDIPALA